MNGNKKIAKKIVAGSMAVMMAAGLAGTYEYHNNVMQVQAAEQKDKDTQELKETAENVLADHATDSEDTGFSKEESVYVKADASGNVKKTMVSEWLKNPEKGTISDTSELKDIKNVKGDETFETGSNNNVSWKSEGNDIYYQGTIDKELPVDVKVSYKLDGKSISPKDLKGKSGKVEIQFSYDNKSKQTVNVNGEDVEMYTPFTMVSAMMLSSDEYSNVSVENGKLISDGDKNIVVGVAFPGLANDLNLKDLDMDIDIPETVTITADVKDATVGTSITMASAELMNEFGLDDIDSFDDLQDSIDDLEDATNQLVDGSKEAADGSKELADGAGTLNDGAGTLASGAGTLADGVNTLNEKSGTLVSGVNTLASGVQAYTGGVEEIYAGSNDLVSGAQELASGATALNEGIKTAKTSADTLASTAAQVQGGIGTVASSLGTAASTLTSILGENGANLTAGVDVTVTGGQATLSDEKIAEIIEEKMADADSTTKEAVKAVVKEALEDSEVSGYTSQKSLNRTGKTIVETINTVSGGLNNAQAKLTDKEHSVLAQGISGVTDGTGALATMLGTEGEKTIGRGAAGVAAGSASLQKGTETLQAGAKKLHDNSSTLNAGLTTLKDGGSQLASGVSQLASGANQVADGAGTLAGGTQTLLDGANTLADGNQTLADGMQEYKEEAIDKLTDLFNGDISAVTDRIDAMTNLAKEYKSFAGISDGVSGTTKFIIETEGIDD
ncbi:hypothetical protein DXD84_05395 [Dorea formicigenerans]|uniref:X-X-X-Leu-X-X-Gly heptad repeats n=1 Tax=Dorea formicigenerans TaxID=39486 RepID=A0A3E4F831_9FIRM|nr:hypothetical protein [Dorea formicigenerans]RGI84894.1 hypothetical protein DXD84_05395 [Dorea formicigenerans]RGI88605.1 hypothetical protein DXD82_04220 [Dorea formicigenerans]RGK50768.1 hypothetical protein DXD10_01265 [Dorea formicigenerans]